MSGGFCTSCGFRVASFEGLTGCPSCGSTNPPCADEDQVTISINWHELRILGIWAENYANSIEEKNPGSTKVIYQITDRIEAQHKGRTPLTLAHEIAALPADLKKAGIDAGTMETNVKNVDRFREGETA
jgi:hypothetical protein